MTIHKLIFLLFSLLPAILVFPQTSDIKILSARDNGLIVEFSPQEWQQHTRKLENKTYSKFAFKGAEMMGEPGSPQIPVKVFTLGIPENASTEVEIVDLTFEEINNVLLLPVPFSSNKSLGTAYSYQPEQSIYASGDAIPAHNVVTGDPYIFRSQTVQKLVLQPLQFFPAQKKIKKINRMTIRIRFSNHYSRPFQPMKDESFYQSLLNYEQAKKWRHNQPLPKRSTYKLDPDDWYKLIIQSDGSGGKEGIYKVTASQLQDAGLPIGSIDPRTLQLFNNGGKPLAVDISTPRPDSLIENPILVVGEEDGVLNAGDYILFYGRSLEGVEYDKNKGEYYHYINPYSSENVYWLTFGKGAGKRITKRPSLSTEGLTPESGFRQTVFWEQEKHNIFGSGRDWFGYQMGKIQKSFTHTFDTPDATADDSTIVRLQMAVVTNGLHPFRIFVNETFLSETSIRGYSTRNNYNYVLDDVTLSKQNLIDRDQSNLVIEYPVESDLFISYVDWVEIEYDRQFIAKDEQLVFTSPPENKTAHYQIEGFAGNDIRILDISDISSIEEIENTLIQNKNVSFAEQTADLVPTKYIAFTPAAYRSVPRIEKEERTDLRSARSADYIIITHEKFIQQAQELASLRETYSTQRLETQVVTISSVFNEFGWGIPDVVAIRDFLAWADKQWNAPQYVLLFGDGHYDYKNILKFNTPNLIPPFETRDRHENYSRTSDDWFTYTKGTTAGMQMAIGRIPVQSIATAQAVVQKIIKYETDESFGDWRKVLTIIGDDELGEYGEELEHTRQAEKLAESHVPSAFDIEKIYLMEYPPVRTASTTGITKPTATEDLLHRINRGTLVLNFIGHGNDELWTHEHLLTRTSDFDRIQNENRLPLIVAATCEFAYWDQPQKQSFAEDLLNVAGRGAVGLIASSRAAFSSDNAAYNYALYDKLFSPYQSSGMTERIGMASLLAKQNTLSRDNKEKYHVLGDPTMRLRAPRYSAIIETIEPDTIQALRKTKVTGHIEKNNALWNDYNGKIYLRIMDSKNRKTYETEGGLSISYLLPGNGLFRGSADVENGHFAADFIVPKDISYGGSQGKISAYFWNQSAEGTGYKEKLMVGGTAKNLIDHTGPYIRAYFHQPNFSAGDYIRPSDTLHVEISDSLSGINITGEIGHQITMTFDNDILNSRNITDFFEYDPNSYITGKIHYPLYNLSLGKHQVEIKAWDNSNNSSIYETWFTVVEDSILKIRDLLTYPNPMTEETAFCFEITQDANVSIKVFSLAGRLLKTFHPVYTQTGYNVLPERWDGTDEEGDYLANGVYLYKLTAKSFWEGKEHKINRIGKVIIAR